MARERGSPTGTPPRRFRWRAMGHDKVYDDASQVSAEKGEVLVDGPDGVAVSLTPEAALETSERLLDAGATARGQRVMEEWRRKERDRP